MFYFKYEESGRILRRARKESGLTVKEVAALIGTKRIATIYEWETGRSLPGMEYLFQLSLLYNVHAELLLAYEGGEPVIYSSFGKNRDLFTLAA